MGNTKHICYCKGGKGTCKRLSDRDKRLQATEDWATLKSNLDRYMEGDACIGEISAESKKEAAAIQEEASGFSTLLENLTQSRLSSDHQSTISNMRGVAKSLSTIMAATAQIISADRIANATMENDQEQMAFTDEHRFTDKHKASLKELSSLLAKSCDQAMAELAEAVRKGHAGSIIHHTALISDIVYEMLNLSLFPIPQCDVSTEELLPHDHPHRKILELDHAN